MRRASPRFLLPRLLLAAAVSAALCALAGCLRRESLVDQGTREQVLHRNVGQDLADLDPQLATAAGDYDVLSALCEGLVAEDPVDLHPVPGVAERWEQSDDGLTYTFHLRANARWSNSEPVTAQDFVGSWRRMLTPTLGADNANLLFIIQGAEAFHRGLVGFDQVGLTAPDAHTLRVTLEHPAPYFLAMLNHTAWFPVHLPTLRKYGEVAQRGNPWAREGRFVGNGPFVLDRWRLGQDIVVKKSPTYWDAAHVRLNGIDFHLIESVDAEERAFRAGQLHLTSALPPDKIAYYRRTAPELLRIDPLLATYFYRFNVTKAYLSDARIRRALAMAVDRAAIVTQVLKGEQRPAHAFTPPGTAGYTAAAGIPTDFAAARALLAEAGFPGGKGLPAFELMFNTSETHRVIAEAIQEMWRRELGVEVRLVNQEFKSTLALRRSGDFQIMRAVWNGDYVDPSSFLDIWRSDNGNNYSRWSNSTYDGLLFAASRTADPAARRELFQKAEAVLLDAAPLIPIYHYTHVFLCQPAVKGWYPTLLDHHPYKDVWLQK